MSAALVRRGAVAVTAVLLGALAPAVYESASAETWQVPNGYVNSVGATVINDGHVDIASVLDENKKLVTRVKDSATSQTPILRDPAKTILQLLPGSRQQVPASSDYAFLGAPGSTVWQVSQTQQAGLLWPGWSTEAIPVDATLTGVDWTISSVQGPGRFFIYTLGTFGSPTLVFDGNGSWPQTHTIAKNTHTHGFWAFTAEGVYCLSGSRSTVLADGTPVSDPVTVAVAVGNADVTRINPAACVGSTVQTVLPPAAPTLTTPEIKPKAPAVVTASAKPPTVRRGKKLVVTVRVRAVGTTPSGTVVVGVAGRSAKAKLVNGRAVVRLRIPARAKAGRAKVRVRYSGDDAVLARTASPVAIRIRR